MGQGAKRNDPCFCGSGVKFKQCHLNRFEQEPVNPFKAEQERQRRKPRTCLHPNSSECSSTIVKAHTLQRKGCLSGIAEKGHVLGLCASTKTLTENEGRLGMRRVGLKKASTFTGFCSFHDSETFAPIERGPFVPSKKNCGLLAYRVLCRELYTKAASLDSMDLLRTIDRGRHPLVQRQVQEFFGILEHGVERGLADLEAQKAAFDTMLVSGDFSGTSYYVVHLESVPDVMAAFGVYPQCDFDGRPLQDLAQAGIGLDAVWVSLITTEAGGALVFAWAGEAHGTCTRLVESLAELGGAEIPNAIVRMIFEFSENTFVRPAWWQGLGELERSSLLGRATLSATVTALRDPQCLLPDGRSYVDWTVSGTELVLAHGPSTHESHE
jgi:hypothetical protein